MGGAPGGGPAPQCSFIRAASVTASVTAARTLRDKSWKVYKLPQVPGLLAFSELQVRNGSSGEGRNFSWLLHQELSPERALPGCGAADTPRRWTWNILACLAPTCPAGEYRAACIAPHGNLLLL